MNRYFILVFATIGLFMCNTLSAQTLSAKEFSEFLPLSLQKMSVKIHQAVKKGDLVVYADDKLDRAIARDAYNIIGMEEIAFVVQNPANPTDPTDVIDTTAFMYLSDGNLVPDMSFSFAIHTDRKGRQIRTVQALAPTYQKWFNVGKGYYFFKPTGWVPLKSIKKILSSEEMELINSYAWIKQMEPPQFLRKEADTTIGLNELIEYTITENRLTLSGCEMAKNLGSSLHNRLRYALFEAYKKGAFVLQTKDSLVTAKSFLSQFSRIEAVAMQNPHSDDPEDVIDTLHTVEPIAFDELGFEKRGNKTMVLITQKKSQQTGVFTSFAFAVPLNEVKKWLHPMESKLIVLAIKFKVMGI